MSLVGPRRRQTRRISSPSMPRLANWPWRNRTHPLPVRRQCQLLKLAPSTACYHPTLVSEIALARMRRIDERHLQYPFACTRMLRDLLR